MISRVVNIEIRLVKDHFELKDFDLVQIEITPKVNERIEWKSLNPQIVAVNDKGQISAVAKEGAAKVKAVYKNSAIIDDYDLDVLGEIFRVNGKIRRSGSAAVDKWNVVEANIYRYLFNK